MQTVDWRTPLHFAAQSGHATVARTIIAAGANVDAKSKHRWTPLHDAASEGRASVIRVLVSAGASLDIQNTEEATALDLALAKETRKEWHETIDILKGAGKPWHWRPWEDDAHIQHDHEEV